MWLEHPKYVPARERLVTYLSSNKYRFRRLEPVLFICGAANSAPRDVLRNYLRSHLPRIGVFYAERVWEQIASHVELGALKMEADLADLADLVVIFVESPGTFAELGAFSLSPALRKKLLPIVDKQYEREASFISTGPLRWIDADSQFRPTIFVALSKCLEAIDQIEERISRIPKSGTTRIEDLAESPKHLLFFLCDLVAVIYPADLRSIEYYLDRIAPSVFKSQISVPTLIGLGLAMGLLQTHDITIDGDRRKVVSPVKRDALERPFHHQRLLDLPTQRADHISVMLTIPEAAEVISQVDGGAYAC